MDKFFAEDPVGVETVSILLEDADEALEWVCAWWMLRIDETDDEVDLRPRNPVEERRYELRGVSAEGESEFR